MQNQQGFTLIELLLYISISGVVLLAISVLFSILLQAGVKHETMAEVDGQGAAVMMAITQTLRNAQEVTAPTPGTSRDELTLLVDNPDGTVVYGVSGDSIVVTVGAGQPVLLTNSNVRVSNFVVENLTRPGTPGNVRVTFTLTRSSPSVRNEYNYSRVFEGAASLRHP